MTMSRQQLERTKRSLTPTKTEHPEVAQPLNVVHFATGKEFLGKYLYPVQVTILKVMCLAVELFTEFDRERIAEWCAGFTLADQDSDAWQGTEGTPGDLLERIDWCVNEGRPWFREVLLLIGRRGGKNHLAAIFAAWVLWNLITLEDPHRRYGIDSAKRLTFLVFAGKRDDAIRQPFKDLKNVIEGAACFKALYPKSTRGSLLLFTPAQVARGDHRNGVDALIEIRAAETTELGARGPAVPMLLFDEFAHLRGTGPTADSVDLYDAAMPATEQFGNEAAIVQTTSPWDKLGQSWKSTKRACGRDATTGAPTDPDYLLLQLPSWAPYEHWARAGELAMWPGGPRFEEGHGPILELNDRLLREEAANPETFLVEWRSHWRESRYAYFSPHFKSLLFGPYKGRLLTMQTEGPLGTVYFAHGDPSLSQANFGFAMLHVEHDELNIPHLVYDLIHHWSPRDFPDGVINYEQVEDEIFDIIRRFNLTKLTFDPWNSAGSIQKLRTRVARSGLPWATDVSETHPTAELNWQAYEVFKTAIGHGIVHAPAYALAEAEFSSVQLVNGKIVPADAGDTRTKDVLDAMVFAAYSAIGDGSEELFARLAELPVLATRSVPPTVAAMSKIDIISQQFSACYNQVNMHAAQRGYQGHNPARGMRPTPRRGRPW